MYRFFEDRFQSLAYHCDCVADVRSGVSIFAKAPLLKLIGEDAEFAQSMMAGLSRLVRLLHPQLELRSIRSASERVLGALMLKEPTGGGWFKIDGTFKDMASEIGLTHEAFYRAMRDLEASRHSSRGISLFENWSTRRTLGKDITSLVKDRAPIDPPGLVVLDG